MKNTETQYAFNRNIAARILSQTPVWIRRHGDASGGATILAKFADRVNPHPFFAGLVLGTVAMLGLGIWARQHDTYGDRVRFFQAISPERSIYPTLDNLASFVRGKASPDKILVLISGSSITLGIGQPEAQLWSHDLQRALGEEFCVVNVSFRSNRYNLVALPLMRRLREDYPRSVFISDFGPTDQGPTPINTENRNIPYDYVAWQMLAREILRGDSAAIGEVLKEFRLSERSQKAYVQERFLAGMWEFLAGSSSWWNWVGYRVVFTTNIFSYPIKPVCLLKDDDRKESYLPSPKRFKENESKEMDILRQQIRRGREIQALPSGDGGALPGLIESFRDEDLKRRAVFLVNAWSSYYVARLNLRDKAFYQKMVKVQEQALQNAGFGAVAIGLNYPFSYYVDGQHFSWEASPQIAQDVAREVRRVCRERGF